MSEKINISTEGIYIEKRINVTDTVRLMENMSSISSVLYTKVSPVITENNIRNSVLSLSGSCNVEMIYIAESTNADRISFSVPFDVTEHCEKERGVFFGKCEVYSVDITPIKGRRCDVSIYLDICGYVFGDDEIITEPDLMQSCRIYKDETTKEITKTNMISKKDTFEYVHPSGFSDGVKIIYSDAEVYDLQTNHSSAGILINGVIRKNIVYSRLNDDDTYSFYVIDESVSFNQFCEVGYSLNFTDYCVSSYISSVDSYVQSGEDEAVLCMDVTVSSEIFLMNDEKVSMIKDIFSPDMDIKCDINDKVCCKIRKTGQKEIEMRGVSPVNSNSVFNRPVVGKEKVRIDVFPQDAGVTVNVKCESECVLLKSERGEMDVSEVTLSDSFIMECNPASDGRYVANYTINDISRNVSGTNMETVCRMTVDVYEISSVTVSEISECTSEPYPTQDSEYITVRIHYDTKNTSSFEIAKENRKSVDEVNAILNRQRESGENVPVIIWNNAE